MKVNGLIFVWACTTHKDEMLAYTFMVCFNPKISNEFYDAHTFLSQNIEYHLLPDFLFAVRDPLHDSIISFRWGLADFTFYEDKLSPIITSEGLCYSFNMLDRDKLFTKDVYTDYYEKYKIDHQPFTNWTLENGFSKEESSNFPLRTTLTGISGGLFMVLETKDEDINYMCGDTIQGFKIVLHHPGQIPNPNRGYIRVGLSQDVAVAVKPQVMQSSSSVRYYTPEKRKCYFEGEKILRYFRIYDEQNCLLECLTNYTRAYCHCVAFYMPRKRYHNICQLELIHCMEEASAIYLTKEGKEKLYQKRNRSDYDCTCLPSCTTLDFETEISQSEWNWKAAAAASKFGMDSSESNGKHYRSRFNIFFKEMQFITLERTEFSSQTDFLGTCGGLIGLLTGFSLISLVETLYFLTLRLFSNLHKFGRHYWSGANELLEN